MTTLIFSGKSALATYEPLVEKSLSNIVEVKSRGAEVIAMTTERTVSLIESQASEVFVIFPPAHHSTVTDFARFLGLSISQPRFNAT